MAWQDSGTAEPSRLWSWRSGAPSEQAGHGATPTRSLPGRPQAPETRRCLLLRALRGALASRGEQAPWPPSPAASHCQLKRLPPLLPIPEAIHLGCDAPRP